MHPIPKSFPLLSLCLIAQISHAGFFTPSATVDELSISLNIPNKTYNSAGIKINTPGVSLAGSQPDCTVISNGYCRFSINDSTPATIALAGLDISPVNITLCLNANGPISCQNYNVTKPMNLDNMTLDAFDLVEDLDSPYRAMTTAQAGIRDGAFHSFSTAPTNGTYAIVNGFDGGGPGHILLGKDLLAGYNTVTFDYRAGWDMVPYGASQNRTFTFRIEPYGGGTALQETVILTANAGTNVNDTGAQSSTIDISSFNTQNIRIVFDWYIPESFTGPALFQLDNINIS